VVELLSDVGVADMGVFALAFFYREQAAEMREASQRVSFVNQVSHELKTPLTNIRLYAELLEDDIRARGHGTISPHTLPGRHRFRASA
jgi:signal transduction histidine kinase